MRSASRCDHAIAWDPQGRSTIETSDMFLSMPDEEGLFGFDEPFVIDRDDVLITRSDLNRFEAEHGITPQAVQSGSQGKSTKPSPDSEPKLYPKEKESLLKMVIDMAIDGYGYNPADKKSPIPAEIVVHVEELGLAIDMDNP